MDIKTYDVVKSNKNTAKMKVNEDGDYVRWRDVVKWLKETRNDVPMTGVEAANTLTYMLNNKEL